MSFVKKGKKSRNELFLPNLRYVVADNWIDTLGPIAFTAWLKLHSWVDRRDEYREHDRVPYTLEDVAKKLKMSKSKLYRTVIKPLWEHELIDLVEYEESKRKTQKPKNIIVYESPRNELITEAQPLIKTRDWKKDYGSSAQIYGRKGGRPKKTDQKIEEISYRFKNETVRNNRFKNETVTVSKMKPSNVSNNLDNYTNNNNNNKRASENKTVSASNNKQKDVVVVLKEKFEKIFKKELPMETAKEFVTLAEQKGKDVIHDCLKNTVLHLKRIKDETGQSPKNPIGALRYGIERGWNIEESIPVKKKPKRENERKKEERRKHYEDLTRKVLIASGIDPSKHGYGVDAR